MSIILAIVVILMLFIKPIIGIADNGDFFRIMQPNGLYYFPQSFSDRHFGYFNRLFGIRRYAYEVQNFLSSQSVPIAISVWIDQIFRHDYVFDIRSLGFVYSFFFILSIFIIIKFNKPQNRIKQCIFAAMILIIFADVGYVAYFNSLYGEPASYVFLFTLLAALSVLSMSSKPKIYHMLFYTFSSILFVGAKQQNSPVGIFLAVLCIMHFGMRKDWKWRTVSIISFAAILLTSIVIYEAISPDIKYINEYHTITLGILKDSPDPGKDLEELGIDPKFSILKGTTFYDPYPVIVPDSPVMIKEFYNKFSFTKILLFYIRHNDRLSKALNLAAKNAFYIRPIGMGNYEKSAGKKYGAMTKTFSMWSSFKENSIPHTFRFIVLFYLSFFIVSLIKYITDKEHKNRRQIEMLWLVKCIGIVQFMTSIIGAGEADLAKHLFLFNVCFDIMFGAAAVFILSLLVSVKQRR